MKITDLVWLAGFLEGEGCFFSVCAGPKRPHATQIGISVVSIDKDVIQRAALLMDCNVNGLNRLTPTRKTVYDARIYGAKAIALMNRLLPHMGKRRSAKIKQVIKAFKLRPGTAWGEHQGQSKLTVSRVVHLREIAQSNPPRGWQTALAMAWNVSSAAISDAALGKNWAKVPLTAVKP